MDLIDGQCVEVPSDAFKGKPIGYTQRTIKEGKQLILRSRSSDLEEVTTLFGDTSRRSASLMFVPILDGGHVIGVLSIQSYTSNAYTRADLDLLESLAEHCGGALGRIQAEERARAFAALGEKLGAVTTPREAALVIANTADELLGWDSCFIRSYSAEDNVMHRILSFDIVNGKRMEIPSMGSSRPTPLIARTIREGKLLILRDDPSQDLGMTRIGDLSRPSASLMFVPMRRGGKAVGILSIQSYTPNAYTEESLEALQALADHCSGALDRIQAEARIKTFSSLGDKLNLASTPLEVARLIVATADQLLGWDSCYLYTYTAQDNLTHPILIMDIMNGQRTELPNPTTREPGPLIARALREGGFLLQGKDSRGSVEAVPLGDVSRPSASILLVPIRKGERIVGVLSIQSYTPDQYSAEDLRALQTLADYGGGALDRIQAEIALSESEERYALAMQGANDGIWDWNLKTNDIYFSPRWKTILGFEEQEIGSAPEEWFSRVHGEDVKSLKESLEAHRTGDALHFENEHRILHKDGKYRWVLSRGLAIRDLKGEATRIAGSLTDITQRKVIEEQLRHSALCDALTELPNRNLFLAHLTHALERQKRRTNYLLAVLFLDLDRFKVVNDSLGHEIGDKLLIGIGRRIQTCIRPMDTVARLGGDEFCVLVDDIKEISDALRVAERIHRELAKPFRLDGNDVFTGVSIGIAVSKNGQQKPEDLVRDADTAMYRAKAQGRGHHQVFDPAMHTNAVALLRLETDLRLAIERQEFRLHYQPILSLETGRVIGFEALLRWQHPERGLLLPAEFLSLAEDTRLILPIGRWALRKACKEAFVWQTAYPANPPLFISVNLSAREFAQKNLDVEVARILRETGLNPRSLIIEITESVVMENVESTARMLSKLKALNIQLHVDDFGTGYSSLSYLHRFPIDALKIDHLFIGAMGVSGEDSEIVRTIIGLARGLGMGIVAEGIESNEQLAELRKHHCPSGQGFLFSHPVPAEQVEAILQENKTSAQHYPSAP